MHKLKLLSRLLAVACITGMLAVPFSTIFASTAANFIVTNNGSYEVGPNFSNQLAMQFDLPDPSGTDTILRSGTTVDVIAGDALSAFGANDKFADDDHDDDTSDYSDGLLIVNSADNIVSSAEIITPGTADLTATWGNVKFGDEDHDDAQDYDGNVSNVLLVDSADNVISPGEIIHDGLADLTPLGSPLFYLETDGNSTYNDGEDIIFLEHDGASAVTADGDTITLFGPNDYYSDADGDTYYTNGEVIVSSADANLDPGDTIVTAGSTTSVSTTFCGLAPSGNCSYYDPAPPGIPYCVIDDVDTSGTITTGDILISDMCATGNGDNYTFVGGEAQLGGALTAIPGTDKFFDDNTNNEHDSTELVWSDTGTSGVLEAGELLFGFSSVALTSLNGSTTSFFNDHGTANGTYDDGEDIFILEFGGAVNNVAGGDTIRTFDASEKFSDADNDGSFSYDAVIGGTSELIANSADAILSNAEIVTAGYVDVTAFGGNYKYSDANNDSVFNTGELIADSADATLSGTEIKLDGTVDLNGFDANTRFYDIGGAGYTDQDDIITDGDQSTYYNADKLTSIQIGNPGTCVDADLAAITIWEDDGDNVFNPAADTGIGVLAVAPFIGQTITTGGSSIYTATSANRTIFASVNFAANPTDGCTFNARIPQNGVVLLSTNDGPTDGPVSTADTLTVDNLAPSVSLVTPNDTLISDPDVGANKFCLDIDYDDNMDPLSTPVVTFTPNIIASGTLTINTVSWTDTDTYRACYNVADVNENQTLTNINISGATDTAGNTQNAYAGGGAGVVVKTVNPTVLSVTPSPSLLTDADVGAAAFTITVVFSETMDATKPNEPTIALQSPAPTGLSISGSSWTMTNVANDTYTFIYDLDDNNETALNIDLSQGFLGVVLARDLSGNFQNAINQADVFSIDTQNPTVTGITPNDLLIADNDVGAGNFTINIAYGEVMSAASTPVVTFTPDIVASGTLTLSGGFWTAVNTYQAVYDVADVNENVTLTNINVSGATDSNGNVQVAFNDATGAGVQVNTIGPVITIVTPANGGNTRMATPLVVTTDVNTNCTYDLDSAGPVAMNQTGGTIHTDNLVGLAAGAHTVDISCTDIVTANVSTDSSTWTKQAPGNMVLYGVDGAGQALGVLWTLNPETGAKLTNIGPVGTYYVTGLAVNPVTGRMYASTGAKPSGNDGEQSLLEIDMTTGAATYLGKNWDGIASNHHLADIGFDSTGQLYGWSEVDDNLYSVSLASCNGNTCSATFVGASGLSTYGSGMSFDSGNNLYFVGEGEDDNMYTISTTTGAPVLTVPLLNGTGNSYSLNASAFDSTDMFFSARGNFAAAPSALVVIDTPTGIVASLGDIADMILMNAIEIYEDTLDPVITITAPTKSSTTTITNTTVRVIDPGGILAANVLATGGTLNCTQTSGTQVDCTSSITVSGTLTVTATDNRGNAGVLAEAGYTITTTTGGGGGGSAGGSGTPYVPPSTTTAEEAAAEEAAAEEEETTEEPALTEATEEEMAAAEEALSDIADHWAAQYIARVFTDGYIQGYEDQTFKPDQEITRAEASKLIAMWLNDALTDADCDGTLFSDVSCDDWYGKFVTYLYIREIILGYEDGTFGPDQSITRAEALKILIYAKLLQSTDISDIVNPFSDVSAEDWFHNIVMIAYKLSIVEGYEDGTFGPNNSITRAEFTKIFVETLLNN